MKQYYATDEGNRVLTALGITLSNFECLAEAVILESGDVEFAETIRDDIALGHVGFEGVKALIQALVGELNLALLTLEEFNKEYHDGSYQIDYRAYTTAQGMLSDEDGYFVEWDQDQQEGSDDKKTGCE